MCTFCGILTPTNSIHSCMPVPVLHHSLLKLHQLSYIQRIVLSKVIRMPIYVYIVVNHPLITRVHLFVKAHIMQICKVHTYHNKGETAGTTDVGQCCNYRVSIVSTAVFTLQSYKSAHWYRGSKCLCRYSAHKSRSGTCVLAVLLDFLSFSDTLIPVISLRE